MFRGISERITEVFGRGFFAAMAGGLLFLLPFWGFRVRGWGRRNRLVVGLLPLLVAPLAFFGFRTMAFELAGVLVFALASCLFTIGSLQAFPPEIRGRPGIRLRMSLVAFFAAFCLVLAMVSIQLVHERYYVLRVNTEWARPAVRAGETLLARRDPFAAHPPRRDQLVLFGEGRSLGVIVALPGDEVALSERDLIVNGQLPYPAYPEDQGIVPLAGRSTLSRVDPGQVLVIQFTAWGRNPTLLRQEKVTGGVVGVVFPAFRRRWLG